MSSSGGSISTVLVISLGMYLAALIVSRARRNVDKDHAERIRLPKAILYMGWFLILLNIPIAIPKMIEIFRGIDLGLNLGFLPILWSFAIGGIFALVMYRNWYLLITEDSVRWRTRILARTYEMPFTRIARYRIKDTRIGPSVTVWRDDGRRFTFAQAYFQARPLMEYLQANPHLNRRR